MDQNQSPFGIERRLTLELLDHYVARARQERAKAIAGFGRQLIAAASRTTARLVGRRRPVASIPLDRADPLTR
jgi:hypothetical protein